MSSPRQSVHVQTEQNASSDSVSTTLVPTTQASIPPCKPVYGKHRHQEYAKRYDRVGHPDEITKVIIVGLCMGMWLWRILGLGIVYAVCLFALAGVATVTRQRYEELRGRWRWMFNTIMRFGCWMNLLFLGIYHVEEREVSKQEFDRIRERYSRITPEEEKAMNYPPFYVIANHCSIADPAVCMYVQGPLSVVAKRGLKSVPIFGIICQLIQCLFVGENNQQTVEQLYQREKSYIEKITKAPKKKLHRKVPPQMLIFPEGTCTNGRQIIRFHAGAFKNGQAVQPMVIRYPYKHFNMSWVNMGIGFFPYILGQVYNRCQVYKLPPYIPNEAEKADWQLYAYNVQRVMVDVVNMYLHDDEKIFASDDLFFRHAPRATEEEGAGQGESGETAEPEAAAVSPDEAAGAAPSAQDEFVVIVKPTTPLSASSAARTPSSRKHVSSTNGKRTSLRERASNRLNAISEDFHDQIHDSFHVQTDTPEDFGIVTNFKDAQTPQSAATSGNSRKVQSGSVEIRDGIEQ